MRSASPGFQPDRPGSPGFQLAEAAGYQTQTPVAVGAYELHLTLDGATDRYARANEAVGELSLVLTLDAETYGPRVPVTGGSTFRPNRYEVPVEPLLLVLTLDAETWVVDLEQLLAEDDALLLLL